MGDSCKQLVWESSLNNQYNADPECIISAWENSLNNQYKLSECITVSA